MVLLVHNQLLNCIIHVAYMYNVLLEMMSQEIILLQEEIQFPCNISGPLFTWFTCFDKYGLHYNVG